MDEQYSAQYRESFIKNREFYALSFCMCSLFFRDQATAEKRKEKTRNDRGIEGGRRSYKFRH